jgi:hypothetical protein
VEAWATAISAGLALGALLFSAATWRQSQKQRELRDSDVLDWAKRCIYQLQTLELALTLLPADLEARLVGITYETSCLIEIGRLFFCNDKPTEFGQEKPAAYRGYRPIILDQLVIAHQIACRTPESDEDLVRRFRMLSKNALQSFVSLAQKEVGRSRTASEESKLGGSGIDIIQMAYEIPAQQLPPKTKRFL